MNEAVCKSASIWPMPQNQSRHGRSCKVQDAVHKPSCGPSRQGPHPTSVRDAYPGVQILSTANNIVVRNECNDIAYSIIDFVITFIGWLSDACI